MTQTPAAATPIPVITAAEADAYFLTTPRNTAWVAITPATMRPLLLTEAERWLRGLCPNPDAEGCCGVFSDAWAAAVSELALAIHQNPTAIIGGAAAAGPVGEVKSQKLGDLSIEFYQSRSGEAPVQASRYGPRAPLVLRALPWLGDILGCWLPSYGSGTSGVIARYRS
jgi:hypothetical protein